MFVGSMRPCAFRYLFNFRMLLLLPKGAEILNIVDSQGKCIEMVCVKISIISQQKYDGHRSEIVWI